jgi:lipopolysaccharide transport system permease protein
VPYLLFLLVGMTGWLVIERTVFWATRSFDIYRKVAGRLEVPVLLVPTAAAAPMVVEVGIMFMLMLVTAGVYWAQDGSLSLELGPNTVVAVGGYALAIAIALGLGLWLAALNALARDVRQVVRIVLPVWLFITPVIYPPSALPERWQFLATINPAAAPVEMVKKGILGVGSVPAGALAISLVACGLLWASGLWFLRLLSPRLLRSDVSFVEDEEEDEFPI